jgi:hypothetical protein
VALTSNRVLISSRLRTSYERKDVATFGSSPIWSSINDITYFLKDEDIVGINKEYSIDHVLAGEGKGVVGSAPH